MYLNFYGLKEKPFQILPDPRYFFLSSKHKSALSYLEYGLLKQCWFYCDYRGNRDRKDNPDQKVSKLFGQGDHYGRYF